MPQSLGGTRCEKCLTGIIGRHSRGCREVREKRTAQRIGVVFRAGRDEGARHQAPIALRADRFLQRLSAEAHPLVWPITPRGVEHSSIQQMRHTPDRWLQPASPCRTNKDAPSRLCDSGCPSGHWRRVLADGLAEGAHNSDVM